MDKRSDLFYFPDMLQLINNQDMEFGGLFDPSTFSGGPSTQEMTGLSQTITSAAPPAATTTPTSSSTSSILSSNPHLDALLGPPITRSSSSPDKTFQPPTFQQSPLSHLPISTPRQQPSSTPQPQSLRQPQVEQPQPTVSPSAPAKAASPHGSPNPAFTSTTQVFFTSAAPQTQPQPQSQVPPQAQSSFKSQISCTGESSLMAMITS